MTSRNPFAQESREQITKSAVNWSHSKQLWTFPKRRRFHAPKPECPHAYYQQNFSSLSNIQVRFTSSTRRLFTQGIDAPSPADYFQEQEKEKSQREGRGQSFGLSREKVRFSSYVKPELANNPGPNKYDKFAGEEEHRARKGYSMRPKTANNRNYFVENKELVQVPGPADYEVDVDKHGESKVAKFRSVTLGGVGLMKKSKRFQGSLIKTPGPSSYQPKKATKSGSIGGRIGNSLRASFIDDINNHRTPGPGDYQLPTQFGHYRKIDVRSRMVTIS